MLAIVFFAALLEAIAATPLSWQTEDYLRHHFFNECHADTGFYDHQVNLDLLFYVFNLVEMDNVAETMSIFATLNLRWSDDCVRWDKQLERGKHMPKKVHEQLENTSQVALPSELFWRPSIIHRNSPDRVQAVIDNGVGLYTNIFRNGWIEWSPTGTWKTSCPLDLRKFPFDVQTCEFAFELWDTQAYTNISAAYIAVDVENPYGFTTPKMIWTLENMSAEVAKTCYPMGNPMEIYCSGEARYYLTVRRKWDPFVFSIFIPSISLALLQISPFAMPPNSPERASHSITILLAFAVIHGLVQEEIPSTAQTIYLVVYINVNIIVGTACAIYTVVSVGLSEWLTESGKTPRKVFVCGGSFLPIHKPVQVTLMRLVDFIFFISVCAILAVSHVVFFHFLLA